MKFWVAAMLAMGACGAAAPASAQRVKALPPPQAQPLTAEFDLTRMDAVDRDSAAPADPVPPRGTDLRAIAWEPPLVEVEMGEGGPVLGVGALGSRRKGVPKLAHVSVHLSF